MFTNKVEHSYHFPALSWTYMTHSQALQGFPNMSEVSLHKSNKSIYLYYSSSSWELESDSYVQTVLLGWSNQGGWDGWGM
jgi:hypothetical protein